MASWMLKTMMTETDDLNSMLSYWLMASYIYYHTEEASPWPDDLFNKISLILLNSYEDISHPHKHLITKEDLICQTGFDIEYPTVVKLCAMDWLEEENNRVNSNN